MKNSPCLHWFKTIYIRLICTSISLPNVLNTEFMMQCYMVTGIGGLSNASFLATSMYSLKIYSWWGHIPMTFISRDQRIKCTSLVIDFYYGTSLMLLKAGFGNNSSFEQYTILFRFSYPLPLYFLIVALASAFGSLYLQCILEIPC